MDFNLFPSLQKNGKEKENVASSLITALSNALDNKEEIKEMTTAEPEMENTAYHRENGLYQVIDFSSKGVWLQDTRSGKTFEENNLPKDFLNTITNDSILCYQNGAYSLEEEITEDFLNSLVDIGTLKKIQENFQKESGILQLDTTTKFQVEQRKEETTIVSFANGAKTLEVPNALVPYFTEVGDIVTYQNGTFKREP